jgi:hypothetical protein
MGPHVLTGDLPQILRETIVGLVRLDDADLSLRQPRRVSANLAEIRAVLSGGARIYACSPGRAESASARL